MISSPDGQQFTLAYPGTLIDEYKKLIEDRSFNMQRIEGTNLDYHVEKNKYSSRPEVLPHIFEIIWMMWNHDLISNQLHFGNRTLWSQTHTRCWDPMEQRDKYMLYIASMVKDTVSTNFTRWDIEVEKAGDRYNSGYIVMLPDTPGVLRSLKADEDSIAEFQAARQFPRDFFEHMVDWKAFNRYSALLDVNRTLTSG